MADTPEAVALRLRDFIAAAQSKASGRGFPTRVNVHMATGAPKDSLLATYEECLSKLTVEQRSELDRLIEIMSGAFRDRSGAIPQTPRP